MLDARKSTGQDFPMCNDHRQRFTRKQLQDAYEVLRDLSDNQPDQGERFPTLYGPVIRIQDGQRVMSNARWGLPSSSQAQFEAATNLADKLRAKGKEFVCRTEDSIRHL